MPIESFCLTQLEKRSILHFNITPHTRWQSLPIWLSINFNHCLFQTHWLAFLCRVWISDNRFSLLIAGWDPRVGRYSIRACFHVSGPGMNRGPVLWQSRRANTSFKYSQRASITVSLTHSPDANSNFCPDKFIAIDPILLLSSQTTPTVTNQANTTKIVYRVQHNGTRCRWQFTCVFFVCVFDELYDRSTLHNTRSEYVKWTGVFVSRSSFRRSYVLLLFRIVLRPRYVYSCSIEAHEAVPSTHEAAQHICFDFFTPI